MLAVLQFDSPSVTLLRRMLAEGRLPAVAGLCERGAWHDLESPSTHFAAGAFHTLYSGTEIADHGLFYPFQWSAEEQRVRYMTAFEAPAPVWERLARRGTKVLAIDPYESRPPRAAPELDPPAPPTVLSGWQLTDRVVLRRWSSPAGAHRRMERLFGPPVPVEEVFGRHRAEELLGLRRRLLAAPGRVADAATLLLREQSPDLAWLTFSAAHVAGHQFWDLSQLAPGESDGGAGEVLGGALEAVYAEVDRALGRVLVALPPDADVVVVSPVGMDVNTSRADLLPEMLAAVLEGGVRPAEARSSIWRLRAALPVGLRARVADALPDRVAVALTARLELRGVDWSTTRAFAQPADNQGYVRLNLRERERDGIVDPEDADALMDEITAGLLTFRDPDGSPAVRQVDRVRDVFGDGTHADRLPDLVVRWSDRPATTLDGVRSDRFGAVLRHGRASGRSGNHTDGDAWAVAVPGTASPLDTGHARRLVDIAATAAELTGDDPSDMPGTPLLRRP